MNNLTRKQRKMLYRILAAAALLIAVKLLPNLFPVPRWMEIPCTWPPISSSAGTSFGRPSATF